MRKLLLVLTLLILALSVLPAAATPVADLTVLAKYAPDSALLFAAIRTDDGFIQEADRLVQHLIAKLPPGTVPPVSLKMVLDLGAQQLQFTDFASAVHPWMGASAAIYIPAYIPSNNREISYNPFMIAISVIDRAKAEAAITDLLAKFNQLDFYKKSTVGSYTVFGNPNLITAVAIGDDVLFLSFGNGTKSLPLDAVSAPLANNIQFKQTVAMLPNRDYSAVLYVNSAALLKTFAPAMSSLTPGMDPLALANLTGAQAAGLTLLDERSLALDIAVNIGNTTTLQKLGLNLETGGALDPAFAQLIPADSSLVLHATNFKALYGNTLQAARFGAAAQQGGGEQIDKGLQQIKGLIQAATGLDFDADILDWLTGDYALFLHMDVPAFSEATLNSILNEQPMTLDSQMVGFGMVIEATDAAKAQAVAAAFDQLLKAASRGNPNFKLSQESIGGTNVTVVSANLPMGGDAAPLALDLLIGANDKVLVIATRPQATAILTGAPGLDTAPAYREARQYFVGNPSSVWYMDANGFAGLTTLPLLALIPAQSAVFTEIIAGLDSTPTPTLTPQEQQRRRLERRQREAAQVQAIFQTTFSLFSSSSISASTSDTGDTVIRVVLTLAP